ncbi:MAG: hypothetical protein IJ523_03555 [Succinivibrionaceae bacterium]|nr:hypothetical protein [Succinivibrionaceae bacterium]
MDVLDSLEENSTLDELGLLQIRNGFADIFFPGTSTIQTRAKYFLIVPYAYRDLELKNISDPDDFEKKMYELEKECARKLLEVSPDETGIIGKRTLETSGKKGAWVKRTAADVYWAGLQNFGIYRESSSRKEYARAVCLRKKEQQISKISRYRNDDAPEFGQDDKDAGSNGSCSSFWNIPTYNADWMDNLSMKLTRKEAEFLKTQITQKHKDSMMSIILESASSEADSTETPLRTFLYEDQLGFHDFANGAIECFPESVQSDYRLAYDFSNFAFAIRTVYNLIVSGDRNQTAIEAWKKICSSEFDKHTRVDLEAIFLRLGHLRTIHSKLQTFLKDCKQLMMNKQSDQLREVIIKRERWLKGDARAKTINPPPLGNPEKDWYGGEHIDYRYSKAKDILKDILNGLGS